MIADLTRMAGDAFSADDIGVTFGVLFAVIWGLSALYAAFTLPRNERARFFAYFLPSAAGGIAVAFATDAISFYLCFALMALPSWGLVAFRRDPDAVRAGRIYLGATILGEGLLLAALMMMVAEAGSTDLAVMRTALPGSHFGSLVFGLVAASFGIKLGAFGASGVLPLTYAFTPTGAAAALAGASVKVGVLGMLRFLPLGEAVPAAWGDVLVVLGLASAFGAAALGVLTTTPKAVLGYSSASQMGLVIIGIGAGLGEPSAAVYAVAAAAAYSLHHGLAKAALFFGEDVSRHVAGRVRKVAFALLALPAFALSGAPFTSGFVAKYALKNATHEAAGSLAHVAEVLLPWAAVGTTLLMLRFFALLLREARNARSEPTGREAGVVSLAVYGLTLASVAITVWVWPATWSDSAARSAFDPSSIWSAVWPIGLAVLVAAAATVVMRPRPHLAAGVVPPGDVWLTLDGSVAALLHSRPALPGRARPRFGRLTLPETLISIEDSWTKWAVAAGIFIGVAVFLVLLVA